jgi:hypothetical protein
MGQSTSTPIEYFQLWGYESLVYLLHGYDRRRRARSYKLLQDSNMGPLTYQESSRSGVGHQLQPRKHGRRSHGRSEQLTHAIPFQLLILVVGVPW